MNAALNRAIRFLGSQAALARSLGIRPQAVQQWTVTGCVPPKRCRAVEDATGGSHPLRPATRCLRCKPSAQNRR
ncbi:MAG: transcriptional regulator [Gammaproteobacteria bacterium]